MYVQCIGVTKEEVGVQTILEETCLDFIALLFNESKTYLRQEFKIEQTLNFSKNHRPQKQHIHKNRIYGKVWTSYKTWF